jgi:hypothetical protein
MHHAIAIFGAYKFSFNAALFQHSTLFFCISTSKIPKENFRIGRYNCSTDALFRQIRLDARGSNIIRDWDHFETKNFHKGFRGCHCRRAASRHAVQWKFDLPEVQIAEPSSGWMFQLWIRNDGGDGLPRLYRGISLSSNTVSQSRVYDQNG